MANKAIEVLLDEKRNFPPPKEFKKSANLKNASIFNTARKRLRDLTDLPYSTMPI